MGLFSSISDYIQDHLASYIANTTTSGGVVVDDAYLLENGSFYLLEDGSYILFQ